MTPKQLRAWRKRRHWTQVTAAANLGIKERGYQRLEAGTAAITPTISILAAALEKQEQMREEVAQIADALVHKGDDATP